MPYRLVFEFWSGWITHFPVRCHNKKSVSCNSTTHIQKLLKKKGGEELTGCSYADQYRGQVKGPCWRGDEHSDVPTRQKAWTKLTPARLGFSGILYLITMAMFTCKVGHWKTWSILVQLLQQLLVQVNWKRKRPHRWFLDCTGGKDNHYSSFTLRCICLLQWTARYFSLFTFFILSCEPAWPTCGTHFR